ncbi:GGDEF domain-containing protein [Nocardioides sp. CER19]|uniref:GGDEF domain-containing protein n=1 Tax=Nocardioides sp. CER19 TaxID=3038538 RepID=UPI002447FBD6|nr:GGDEF domain-containing protein [Nocardioides sp. CER19]MDH2413612.1 GGDEF domain-containing protein [Nocardioides sp. CER19]
MTALIYLIDAVALTCGALLRTPGTNAPQKLGALAVLAVAMAAYTVARGPRFRQPEATVMLAVQLLGIASMTRTTHLDLAALSNGFGLSMLGAYASWLLARPAVAVFYAGLSLWVTAIVWRDNLYLTVAAVLLAGQAMVTAEIVHTLRRRVRRLTDVDPLTDVLNRRGVEDAARELMARQGERGAPICVALIDLDDLRQVNNAHGHRAGDALLVAAADEWRLAFRRTPVKVGRIGGDEFVLLFDGVDEVAARDTVAALRATSGVSWTAGLTQLRPRETFSEALARADAEMYANKEYKASRA